MEVLILYNPLIHISLYSLACAAYKKSETLKFSFSPPRRSTNVVSTLKVAGRDQVMQIMDYLDNSSFLCV